MKHTISDKGFFLPVAFAILVWTLASPAQEWREPVRGSWVRSGPALKGDLVLVSPGKPCEIVVSDTAHSALAQAARFLAADLKQITGQEIPIVSAATPNRVGIRLATVGESAELPGNGSFKKLAGKWEASEVLTVTNGVWLVGSDARGAAFAVYTFCERLGVDPLYLWTGYRPEPHETLVLKPIRYSSGEPTIKYRGMFHDDEDILPRPFEYSGYPLRIGDVPLEWYKKFFETALRLRMNMVAPYTRVHRRFEVQKTASDWGLFYTSHHYDILLSNPFGYHRFGLAEKRGVTGDWNWQSNSQGMLRYWRAGVEENGALDCIWPVGLRGTDDYAYPFPKDMSEEEQNRIFQQVIHEQIEETRKTVPAAKQPPVFHFTLYGEMLDKYLGGGGKFDMPEEVVLIWCDDNDGRMRVLPQNKGKWKHGVYYHLAYWGPVAKQAMHIIPPQRIAHEFRRIVAHGATEFMLVNVSELREFVMEARMIAEISWDEPTALADTVLQPMPGYLLPHVPTASQRPPPPDHPSPSADRYIEWWCQEYFGKAAAADAAESYRLHYALLNRWDMQWYAGDKVTGAINSLIKKFAGQPFAPAQAETLSTLLERQKRYDEVFQVMERARGKMTPAQRQFYFDNLELPLLVTGRHTQAALLLVEAMAEPENRKAWAMCEAAMEHLERLEMEIARAEHPPFDHWYRATFIRHEHTGLNIHKPYLALRAFLASGGADSSHLPDGALRPDLNPFVPLLKEHY